MNFEKNNKPKLSKALQNGIWIFFALSFSMLSFDQMIYFKPKLIFFTVVFSGLISFYLLRKTWDEVIVFVRTHNLHTIACFCMTLIIVMAMYADKRNYYLDTIFHPLPFLPIRFFRFRWIVFTVPALFYLLLWIVMKAIGFLSSFWDSLDREDQKLYVLLTSVASAAVLAAYTFNTGWFMQYDRIYSIDSGFCYLNIFPQLSYYDIRHPIMSVVAFPLWAVIHTVLGWFVPAQLLEILCAACLQLVNVQLLLLIGFMLREMSGSRWTLMLYLVSSPILLFTFFFEKYQLAVFFLVLYVYQLYRKEKGSDTCFILASGLMPTSTFIYANEVLHPEPIKIKLKKTCSVFLQGVAILICTGRAHLLYPKQLMTEVSSMAKRFGMKSIDLKNCLFSLSNMVHSVFLDLSSVVDYDKVIYYWPDVLNKPSILGIVISAIVFLGFLMNLKDRFTQICFVWAGVSVILFCVFQWSVIESPLFGIYFAWALISLFQKGFQAILEKFHWKEQTAYCCILFPMLAVNLLLLIDIGKCLSAF